MTNKTILFISCSLLFAAVSCKKEADPGSTPSNIAGDPVAAAAFNDAFYGWWGKDGEGNPQAPNGLGFDLYMFMDSCLYNNHAAIFFVEGWDVGTVHYSNSFIQGTMLVFSPQTVSNAGSPGSGGNDGEVIMGDIYEYPQPVDNTKYPGGTKKIGTFQITLPHSWEAYLTVNFDSGTSGTSQTLTLLRI